MPFEERLSAADTAPVEMPNFKDAYAAYEARVQEISISIKSGEAQLADILAKIDQAKINLQVQYDTKIASLEQKIADLHTTINILESDYSNVTLNLLEKQKERDSISLDFTERETSITKSWGDFHKGVSELQVAQEKLVKDQTELEKSLASLDSEIKVFHEYKDNQVADIETQISINKQTKDSLDLQKSANDAQTVSLQNMAADSEKRKLDLEKQVADVQLVLGQAAVISAQKAQNDTEAKRNADQALQNQTDATQIKVARVALNNQQQAIAAREQAVAQAEKKIGG